jgi:menaquinone-dependent protoporphyrinogen oxidase
LKEAEELLTLYGQVSPAPPLALASVNLTARKPGKDTAEGNAYLRKWIIRRQLKPALATAIAGRLDYPRYGWLDRQMIRLIMKMTGGPTDPQAQVEYTSWEAVDRFASAIADLADAQTAKAAAPRVK